MAFLSALGGALGGASLGSAVVSVAVDTTQLKRGLAEAKGEVQAGTTSMANAFKALGPAIAVSAVAGLALFSAAAVKAASDETEALNKTNQVFKESSSIITDFAETSAASFGISKTAAYEAAGGFGNMLQAAGLAVDASAEMSVKLTELAADLASFNNVDPAEALAKLASGLTGQARPLRAYGILLSEGRVKQEAYRSGLAAVGAELTDAQKVQARYNLIFQDSIRAQGDFSRTSDELANSQRILNAEWEDFQAQVGEALLPVMRDLVAVLKDLVPLLTLAAGHLSSFLGALGSQLPPVTKGIFDLYGAISGGSDGMETAEQKVAAYKAGLADLALQVQAGTLPFNDAVSAVEALDEQYGIVDDSSTAVALSLQNMTTEQIAGLSATNASADAAGNLQDRFMEEAAAADAAAEAQRNLKEAQDALAGGTVGLISGLDQLEAAQADINRLQKQGKTHTAEYRDAELSLLGQQDSVNHAFEDFAHTLKDNGLGLKDAKDALFDLGRQAGLSKGDVRALASDALAYLRNELGGAAGEANNLTNALNRIPKNVTIRVNTEYYETNVVRNK